MRNRLQMKFEVLRALRDGPLNTTQILTKANINNVTLKVMVQEMEAAGSLKRLPSGFFELTSQGLNGVRFFEQAALMVEGRR